MDEAVNVSHWIALPDGRHNLGIGRHWHFFAVAFWVLNGLVYIAFLFGTVRRADAEPSATSKQHRWRPYRSQHLVTGCPTNSPSRLSSALHASGYSAVAAASGQPCPRMTRCPPPRHGSTTHQAPANLAHDCVKLLARHSAAKTWRSWVRIGM
jgi:hypothetical protein